MSLDWLTGREKNVRYRGKWIKTGNQYTCQNCLRWFTVADGTAKMLFCPHCGEEKE